MYFGGLAAALVLFSGLSLGWWLSHSNNSNAMAQTLARSETVTAQAAALPTEAQAPLQPLFQTLDTLQNVAQPTPDDWVHHLGLNQDDKLQQAEELAASAAEMQAATQSMLAEVGRFTLRRDEPMRAPEVAMNGLPAELMAQIQALILQQTAHSAAPAVKGSSNRDGRGYGSF